MTAVKGRRHRSGVAGHVSLRLRVRPDTRAKAEQTANALGISLAAYIDTLIAQDAVTETGRPVWWTDPVPGDQEALPVSA